MFLLRVIWNEDSLIYSYSFFSLWVSAKVESPDYQCQAHTVSAFPPVTLLPLSSQCWEPFGEWHKPGEREHPQGPEQSQRSRYNNTPLPFFYIVECITEHLPKSDLKMDWWITTSYEHKGTWWLFTLFALVVTWYNMCRWSPVGATQLLILLENTCQWNNWGPNTTRFVPPLMLCRQCFMDKY